MKRRIIALIVLSLLIATLLPASAMAAGIDYSSSLALLYGADSGGTKMSANYWNGFLTQDSQGVQHLIASSGSYLDLSNAENTAQRFIVYNDSGSAQVEAIAYDTDAKVALYKVRGTLPDAAALPLADSSHIELNGAVTVVGFEWANLGGTLISSMHASYETTVTASVAGEKYTFYTLADPAPNADWESAAVINSEGYVVGILVADETMQSFFPMDVLMKTMGFTGDTAGRKAKSPGEHSKTITWVLLIVVVGILAAAFFVYRRRMKAGLGTPKAPMMAQENGGDIPVANDYHPGEKLCIIGLTGYYAGQKFRINGEVTMGRSAARCNLLFPETQRGISSIHCMVRQRGNQLEVKDLGSTYGTFCRGLQMAPNSPVLLSPGEQFSLASPQNTFEVAY